MTAHEVWRSALAIALVALAIRLTVMAWRAARRELPWSRLLLPAIILLEGFGAWRDAALLWPVRLGTVVLLELAFVTVAIRELRRTVVGTEPLEARIARSLEALLPRRAARFAAFELVIVGSALHLLFGGWRRPVPAGFSYHRESGLRSLLPLLPLLALGDILLVDLVFLAHSATWLRLVIHGLGVYGLIWLLGLYASLRARPHQLVAGQLALHRGILGRVTIPVAAIESISPLPSFADDWKQRAYLKGAIRIDLAGPAILELRLRSAVRPIGVLGERAPGMRVLVAVDDPAALTSALAAQLETSVTSAAASRCSIAASTSSAS